MYRTASAKGELRYLLAKCIFPVGSTGTTTNPDRISIPTTLSSRLTPQPMVCMRMRVWTRSPGQSGPPLSAGTKFSARSYRWRASPASKQPLTDSRPLKEYIAFPVFIRSLRYRILRKPNYKLMHVGNSPAMAPTVTGEILAVEVHA
jgi:hypothetical protein